MLKRILILLLCLSFKPFLIAQESFEPSTHIGVHGGVNLSRGGLKPKIKQGFISSRAFGIVFRHVSEPNIGLQFEVNLAGKGWKEIIDSIGTYTRRLETVDVPVMAVFIAGSRRLRFAFTIGPYISYLRHEKETIKIRDAAQYRPHYLKPLVNNWEFGFTGGAAIEFHTKIGGFALRAAYSHALTNLFPLMLMNTISADHETR